MPLEPRLVRLALLGCHGSVLLCGAPARAASLSWEAPAACPGQQEVLARLEAARGGPLAEDPPVDFEAEVAESTDGRLSLRVRTRVADHGDSTKGRTLVANDCEELVAALEQVVSLALGPHKPREPAESGNAPAGELPAAKSAEAARESAAAPSRTRGSAARTGARQDIAPTERSADEEVGLVALRGVLDLASLGVAAFGGELEAGLRLGSTFELRGLLGIVPPRDLASERGDAGGQFTRVVAGAEGCAALREAPWRFPFCAGVEAGRLSATGTGVTAPASKDALWLAARAHIHSELDLSSGVRACFLVGIVVPLARREFRVANATLHEIPLLSPRVGLGVEYGF